MRIRSILLGFVALTLGVSAHAGATPEFQVIAYHDVRDYVREQVDHDQYAISTRHLIDHFTWLRNNGFTPVSVDDLGAAQP